jgi:hypothetical protein
MCIHFLALHASRCHLMSLTASIVAGYVRLWCVRLACWGLDRHSRAASDINIRNAAR